MRIGIIDADLLGRQKHRFPNLACEKISGYWKGLGHEVSLLLSYDNLDKYDHVYISKVFTDTPIPDWLQDTPKIHLGGTGFYFDKAPNLPDEIEHHMPDYSLYDSWIQNEVAKAKEAQGEKFNEVNFMKQFREYTDYSIGFITRGCFRKCKFCVNQKYSHVFPHSPLHEFYDPTRKRICLLDDNFLGCSKWKELLEQIIATGKPFKFKQGLDERILTEEKCEMIFNARYDGDFTFAFDNISDYQDMGKLAETMDNYKTLDYKLLKDAIVDAGSIVENFLGSYIESPTKPKHGKAKTSLVCHSELQLASYIIVVFKLKYELTPDKGLAPNSKQSAKELKRVKEFLYKHYLYDILRGFWAGSGNTKLEEIISDPMTCRYTKDVPKDELERVIAAWFDDTNKKALLTNVSADTKLFLNYLLRTSGYYDEGTCYDVEHCVPKDVIKKYYLNRKIIVPMSAVCNLVYIPSGDNRSKGDSTYYQSQVLDPGAYTLDEQHLAALGYPTHDDLRFVESTDSLTEANYFAFLATRKKVILHKFINALYT